MTPIQSGLMMKNLFQPEETKVSIRRNKSFMPMKQKFQWV